jgi:hypothetical protein
MDRRTALLALAGSVPALRASGSSRVPVLVELFTSEGCSSCPPADALLTHLDRQPIDGVEVIALSEHVDYWNHLGWRDAFSSPLFSARQQQYALSLHKDSVYTPQMIVNGREEAPGSDPQSVFSAIQRAAKAARAALHIERMSAGRDDPPNALRLRVSVDAIPQSLRKETFDLLLAVTESGLSSQVRNGENAGRVLKHNGVVRSLTRVAELEPVKSRGYTATLLTQIARTWDPKSVRAVLFLESRDTRGIAGAAWCALG